MLFIEMHYFDSLKIVKKNVKEQLQTHSHTHKRLTEVHFHTMDSFMKLKTVLGKERLHLSI